MTDNLSDVLAGYLGDPSPNGNNITLGHVDSGQKKKTDQMDISHLDYFSLINHLTSLTVAVP